MLRIQYVPLNKYRKTNTTLGMGAVIAFGLRLQKSVIWWYAYFTTWCIPPRENNKLQRNKEIFRINNVPIPDLPVGSYATRFRGNCLS